MRLDGIGWQQADMEALGATVPIEELRSPLLHGLPDKLLSPLLMALRKKFAGKISCIRLHHIGSTICRLADCCS